jgi:hypothetical protein
MCYIAHVCVCVCVLEGGGRHGSFKYFYEVVGIGAARSCLRVALVVACCHRM